MTSGLFSLPSAPLDADVSAASAALRGSSASPIALVVGPENAIIRALASAVTSAQPPYNPIVLYGPSGVGKSSVARSLAALRRRQLKSANVLTTTAGDLVRALAHAIDADGVAELRSRHQRCDVLVVDDVHRLAGRGPAQQFLLGAVDALVRRGALVLLTLRQAPQATPGLSPRLASRLVGGLVVRVKLPGPQARRRLVRDVAHSLRFDLDDELVSRLADDTSPHLGTAVNLRGAVLSLTAQRDFGVNDLEQHEKSRTDQKPLHPKVVWKGVTSAVGKQFGFSISQLKGKSRRKTIAEARGLAMHLARQLTGASYAEIGRYFGGRDHTTILHACQKLAGVIAKDDAMRRLADELTFQVTADGPA